MFHIHIINRYSNKISIGQSLAHDFNDSDQGQLWEWWKDETLKNGLVSRREINVRVVNMLTYDEDVLQVPSEEHFCEIIERYQKLNSHALSFTWKDVDGNILDLQKTLAENRLDSGETIEEPGEEHAVLLIYFNDDLT